MIDTTIQEVFAKLYGQPCCRQRVGHGRALSLGFGNRLTHSQPKAPDPFYGEWEIGTYRSSWRVIRESRIVCGSGDLVDSVDELDEALGSIEFGSVASISMLSKHDVRVRFDSALLLDFISAAAEDDEIFHIFAPGEIYVEFNPVSGWARGRSDRPWQSA